MADITSIPAARVPVLEPGTTIMSREWYRFLFNQFGQTGSGTTDISISDLSLAPFSAAETEATVGTLRDEVQGLALAPVAPPVSQRYAGGFASTSSQTLAAIDTATAVTFNTTNYARGVALSARSRINISRAGAFVISATISLDKTTGGSCLAYLWLRKNGTDVANSASRWRLKGNDDEVLVPLLATIVLTHGDYVELMWAADDANVILNAHAATAFAPASPSALLSITQVDQ
jgi:hypothetical protein